MSEISVRALTEDEWSTYRSVRLAALQESPHAFVATHDDEAAEPEDFWRARMTRSTRLVAEVEGEEQPVGVVSIGSGTDEDGVESAQLFGLWVAPDWRGRSVAAHLVRRAGEVATQSGRRQLSYWVSTDNARGVAFASSFGFRPTDQRRAMRTSNGGGEEEMAMVLALGDDRAQA